MLSIDDLNKLKINFLEDVNKLNLDDEQFDSIESISRRLGRLQAVGLFLDNIREFIGKAVDDRLFDIPEHQQEMIKNGPETITYEPEHYL